MGGGTAGGQYVAIRRKRERLQSCDVCVQQRLGIPSDGIPEHDVASQATTGKQRFGRVKGQTAHAAGMEAKLFLQTPSAEINDPNRAIE